MFVLPKEEFIEEIRAEMAGYEELTKPLIDDWIERFQKYVQRSNLNSKRIVVKGGNTSIKLEDETELFNIVDRYYVAVDQEEIEAYWQDWTF